MIYIKLYDEFKYKDVIGKGIEHIAYHIDDNWILKIPKLPKYSSYGTKTEFMISNFNNHINFMKAHPEICVKVKKLDKYRASVERVDVAKAKQELKHVYNIFKMIVRKYELWDDIQSDDIFILANIYNDTDDEILPKIMEGLKLYAETDMIIKKWYEFLLKLFAEFPDRRFLDLHSGNIGIDKNGNIKLIDF